MHRPGVVRQRLTESTQSIAFAFHDPLPSINLTRPQYLSIICAITPHGDPSALLMLVEPRSRRIYAIIGVSGQSLASSPGRAGAGRVANTDPEIDAHLEFDPRCTAVILC